MYGGQHQKSLTAPVTVTAEFLFLSVYGCVKTEFPLVCFPRDVKLPRLIPWNVIFLGWDFLDDLSHSGVSPRP